VGHGEAVERVDAAAEQEDEGDRRGELAWAPAVEDEGEPGGAGRGEARHDREGAEVADGGDEARHHEAAGDEARGEGGAEPADGGVGKALELGPERQRQAPQAAGARQQERGGEPCHERSELPVHETLQSAARCPPPGLPSRRR